jgi:serine phosphatase RsbU (regulator of sigma subunit)
VGNDFSKIVEECKKSSKNKNEDVDFPTKDKSTLRIQFSCVPVYEEGEFLYVICIGKDVTEEYLKRQQFLLEQKRKEILYYLDQKIFRAESLSDILSEIVKHVRELNFNIRRISIASYNFEEEIVQIIYSNNAGNFDNEIAIGTFSYPLIDSANTISILKNAEFAINDLNKEQASRMTPTQRFLYNEHGVGCYITFPINYKDELIASMNFGAENDTCFTDDVICFLKELSKDIAVAVYQYKLKEALDIKNVYLEEKNKSIIDSIHYAERIQKAILPSFEDYYKCFDDSFVLLQPKDTLSGDFFWVEDTKNKLWIASVDCTGHGVPGALVSLIGANILNQAIFEQGFEYPNEILAYLNENVIKTLQNSNEQVNDGMDIAICCIDKKKNTLYYAGVMNHMLYIRDNELFECSANRIPIGMNPKRTANDFEVHEVKIEKGDLFYIFTDGFADQFGGEKDKKFGAKKFKKLLLDVADYPMSEQERILKNSFSLWKLDEEQTDDVLVLGFSPKVYK